LESAVIGNGVTNIGRWTFGECSSLESVTIGSGVTGIGEYAFDRCTALTEVTIPDSVTSIGEEAFAECSTLESVTIGSGLTDIGDWAFGGCVSLQSFQVSGANPAYSSAGGVLFDKAGALLILYPCAKSGAYTIPSGVTSISDDAFYRCTGLTAVTIPDSVTDIGMGAFAECSTLESAVIGNGVTNIGRWTFGECSSLESVTIGSGVTSIGDHAFYGCSALTDVYCCGSEEAWAAVSVGENNDPLLNAAFQYSWVPAGPLAITGDLTDYAGPLGSTASFTVEATGTGLTYQWWVKKPTATKFSKSSITGPTYSVTLTEARNGNQVYCVVTDAYGNTAQTSTVSMTVAAALEITGDLTDYAGPLGSTASFTVEATGTGLSYQWWVKKPTATEFSKSSITGPTYSVALTEARNGNQVYCVVTDAYGNTAQTNTVSMTVAEALAITADLTDYTGPLGSTASFTVEATGDGLSYQWWVKKPTATKFSKSSITGPTYSVELTEARNGNQVYCVVTDACGNTAQTNTVSMTVG
ncbi:MAG: leucine-rich repeat protein, partial [Oscillospiraceae bacterium]|nr:leucine-rich repeat protein [Oscillospiraceae bacterium]